MVVDVFSTGPNDLLQVMLNSTAKQHGQSGSESETAVSGLFAWVPFVEAIVPHVDKNQRVMLITPPKGLLELNLRADVRSKKERRCLVHFLEEEKLPVISNSLTEQDGRKLLVKSPWEILESPVGSGGVFGLLSRQRILENLNEMGIEYMEVCSLSQRSYIAHPLFVGFVDSCEADIGMTVLDDDDLDDQNFDIMCSIGFLKRITNQTMLQFYALPQLTPHVEKVDKEWVDINVASPNSYHLHCSIYSSLNACPPDKICLLHASD